MSKTLRLFIMFLLAGFLWSAGKAAAYDAGAVRTIVEVLEDPSGQMRVQDLGSKKFTPIEGSTPNFGLSPSVFWAKLRFDGTINLNKGFLEIANGTVTNATLYCVTPFGVDSQKSGTATPYKDRIFQSQYPVFRVKFATDTPRTYYLKVSGSNVLNLPLYADTMMRVMEAINKDQLFFGIYFGIILVMVFYNIFIYFTVRDSNYLFYVMYIMSVGILQACLKGYASKYFWPQSFEITEQAPNIAIALSGVFSIFFVFNFLNVKKYTPWIDSFLKVLLVLYLVCIGINVSGHLIVAQQLLQGLASVVAITIMTAGIRVYRKGYKPAKFFNISWSFFLTSVVVYILKDAGVLPFNNLTSNSILIGSGFEVSLLSFALADKINTYRKEREESQLQAQAALQENVRIISEQNIILDQKVNERTAELKVVVDELNQTLVDLKEAESQLVESEKMASLGQLTAGIAHEINNPINFVISNIKPLKRDIQMLVAAIGSIESVALSDGNKDEKRLEMERLKADMEYEYVQEEIDLLLAGISEGASRTAEIVKGLRVFTRLDEDDLKKASLNQGLDSTLIIVNNLLNGTIEVVKDYAELPDIDCYPGKLNQVFLNIISNSIYAVRKKFGDARGGMVTIKTRTDGQFAYVTIGDNGIGMDDATKKRLFEPFFTTKEVGEGTGLGLSIVYTTMIKHQGLINVNSELGVGTEFILKLPLVHP